MKIVGIAAMSTGSGKTTVTGAILSAVPHSIQIKIGPDFIDPLIESKITGKHGYNLDRWLQGRMERNIVGLASEKADFAVVEGVMGLYDSGVGKEFSTIAYFERLGIPYILVVDVFKWAESIYYAAKGFIKKNCIGVILNGYAGERHLKMIEDVFLSHGIRIVGKIPYREEFKMPERHLGLNLDQDKEKLIYRSREIAKFIDLSFTEHLPEISGMNSIRRTNVQRKNVYIARDDAFCFYYETSLDYFLKRHNVRFFSPLNDEVPEKAELIYIGGGYPELFGERLESALKLKSFLRDYVDNGGYLYSECGGTMFLMNSMENNDKKYEMAGVFSGKTWMEKRPVLNYTKILCETGGPFFRKGQVIKGHEFHYGRIKTEDKMTMRMIRGNGIEGYDGITRKNAFGMYTHIDFMRYGSSMKWEEK